MASRESGVFLLRAGFQHLAQRLGSLLLLSLRGVEVRQEHAGPLVIREDLQVAKDLLPREIAFSIVLEQQRAIQSEALILSGALASSLA